MVKIVVAERGQRLTEKLAATQIGQRIEMAGCEAREQREYASADLLREDVLIVRGPQTGRRSAFDS